MDYTGSSYEGDMKNDKMEGEGEYTFPSGTKYIGSFKDGQFDGKGTLHFKNGMIVLFRNFFFHSFSLVEKMRLSINFSQQLSNGFCESSIL